MRLVTLTTCTILLMTGTIGTLAPLQSSQDVPTQAPAQVQSLPKLEDSDLSIKEDKGGV